MDTAMTLYDPIRDNIAKIENNIKVIDTLSTRYQKSSRPQEDKGLLTN